MIFSVHQIVVEKIVNEAIFISLDQTQIRLPSNLQNITMATNNDSPVYITAEVLYSTSPSNFTIGDGLYYNGYYNAPLDPGCAYKVHMRIVTKASSGVSGIIRRNAGFDSLLLSIKNIIVSYS
jgi:hypothetical protein